MPTLRLTEAEYAAIERRRAAGKPVVPPAPSEEDIQKTAIELLRLKGFIVLETTVRVRGKTGQSRGIPDVLVSHERWPRGCWTGIETKSDKGGLRPEQALLEAQGRIFVYRSPEEALAFIDRIVWDEFEPDAEAVQEAQMRVDRVRAGRKALGL
jgi:hypothetical protein